VGEWYKCKDGARSVVLLKEAEGTELRWWNEEFRVRD
jgi:hypothetical protein